jgi:hypothetical protein
MSFASMGIRQTQSQYVFWRMYALIYKVLILESTEQEDQNDW